MKPDLLIICRQYTYANATEYYFNNTDDKFGRIWRNLENKENKNSFYYWHN